LIVIGLSLACTLSNARAGMAQLIGRQSEILRATLAADGYLTEDMHRDFWAVMPEALVSDAMSKQNWQRIMGTWGGDATQFQRETWKSVKLTLNSRRVTKTPEFDAARKAIIESTVYRMAPAQFDASLRNADLLLQSAAVGGPFTTSKGQVYITPELVDETLSGLDAAYCRLQQLVQPRWNPHTEERTYPAAHVRILSPGPFQLETSTIAVDGGRTAQMVSVKSNLSDREGVTISFLPEGSSADLEGSTMRAAQASMKAMGVSDAQPMSVRWRDRVTAVASGSADYSGGKIYASVRVIVGPVSAQRWFIQAITTNSLIDAVALRESVEASIQLDTQ
jgi:hypothetical protein